MDNQANDTALAKARVQKTTKKCPECGEENSLSRKNCKKESCQFEFVSQQKMKTKSSYMQQKAVLESQADTLHSEHGFDIAILYWKNQGNGKSLVYRYGTPGKAESFIGSTKLKTSEAGADVMKLFIDYLAAALQNPEETPENDTHPSSGQDGDPNPSTSPPTNLAYQQTPDGQTVSQDGAEVPSNQASVIVSPTETSSSAVARTTDETESEPAAAAETDEASNNITYIKIQTTEDSTASTESSDKPEPMDTSETEVETNARASEEAATTLLSVVGSATATTIILESGQVIQISTEKTEDAKEAEGCTAEERELAQDLVARAMSQAGNGTTADVPMIACVPTAPDPIPVPDDSPVKNTGSGDEEKEKEKESDKQDTSSDTEMAQVETSEKKKDKEEEADTTEESSKSEQAESNWTCHFCRKVFSDNSKLTAHLPTHNKDKPFKCEHCNKSFAQPCSLAKHLARHSDKQGQMFVCEDCGQGFSAYAKLRQHFRVHTGEKPYKCQECGKGFKVASHVVKHQRIHTGERPFVCTECGKAFTESGTLKRHVRTHTGEKPFKCDQCDKAFSQAGSLSMHMHVHLKELMWKTNANQKTTETEQHKEEEEAEAEEEEVHKPDQEIETDQENSANKTNDQEAAVVENSDNQ